MQQINVTKEDILTTYKVLQAIETNHSTHNAVVQVKNILANLLVEIELKNN